MLDSVVQIRENDGQREAFTAPLFVPTEDAVSPLPVADQSSTPTSVYKYFDSRDILIYVGITSAGILRNRQHNSDKQWWPLVARQEIEHLATRSDALQREQSLIELFQPPFNKVHNHKHADHKAVYLSSEFSSEMSDKDKLKPLRSRDSHIGLNWKFDAATHSVELVTFLVDAPVGRYLRFEREPKVVLFNQFGTNVGVIESAELVGLQLRAVAQLRKECSGNIRGAFARVKNSGTKPFFIVIKNVCVSIAGIQSKHTAA